MTTKAICKFNCTCINSRCAYDHYIKFDERVAAKEVYDTLSDEVKAGVEEKSDERRKNCFYGNLCTKKDCGFKHHLNEESRLKFSSLIKQKEKVSKMDKIKNHFKAKLGDKWSEEDDKIFE